MSQFESAPIQSSARTAGAVDEGLRAYMLRVYNYMSCGILLTGIVAYLTYSAAVVRSADAGGFALTAFGQLLYGSPFKWIVMIAPLAFVMILSVLFRKINLVDEKFCFWLFS